MYLVAHACVSLARGLNRYVSFEGCVAIRRENVSVVVVYSWAVSPFESRIDRVHMLAT